MASEILRGIDTHNRLSIRKCPMRQPNSFREIIDLWPTRAALTRDLTDFGGADKVAPARDWYVHDHIPPTWFNPLLAAAAARGFNEVTYRLLSELYKREASPR